MLASLSSDSQIWNAMVIGYGIIEQQSRLSGEMRGWLDQLSPELRAATVSGAGKVFGERPHTNPENYFTQLKEPAEIAAAEAAVAKGRAANDPAEAANLASGIAEPELRWRTLDNFVVDWLRKDPVGAEKWLDSTDAVSPEWAESWRVEGRGNK